MLNSLLIMLRSMIDRFLYDEEGEVNIVATVVLIGIAVVLAIIFRDAIAGLLNSMLETIKGNANNAIAGP